MRGSLIRLGTVALLLWPLTAATARADFIPWSYSWGPGTQTVRADAAGAGMITFNSFPGTGGSNLNQAVSIVAAYVNYAAPGSGVSTFTNQPWSLTLTLTDGTAGPTGSATFMGTFNGTLDPFSTTLANTFTNPSTQNVALGSHEYTATLSYVPPHYPGAQFPGLFLASVTVQQVPEPSSLLLAVVALPGLGLLTRRQRSRMDTAIR